MITSNYFISCVLGSATVASSFVLLPGHFNSTRNGTAINSTGHATGQMTRTSLADSTLSSLHTSGLVLPSAQSYSTNDIELPPTVSSRSEVITTTSSSWIHNIAKPRNSTVLALATSSESHTTAALSSSSTGTAITTIIPQTAHSSTGYALTTIGPRSSSIVVRPVKPLYYSNTTSGLSSGASTSKISSTGSFYTTSNSGPLPTVTEPPQWSPISNSTQIRVSTSSDLESPSSSLLFGSSQGSNRTLASLSIPGSPSNVSSLPSMHSSSLLQSEPAPIITPAATLNTTPIIQPTFVMNMSQFPAINTSVLISTTQSSGVPLGPGTPFRFANFTPNWNDSSYLIPSNARLGASNSEPLIHD